MRYKAFFVPFLLILIFLSGCTSSSQNINIKKTNIMGEKKILMIVAPENFRDEEFLEPKKVFENNGLKVTVASKGVKEATSMVKRIKIKVDLDVEEVNVTNYDAIVFIGGSGASIYYDDQTVLNIAKEAYEKNKVVGAICIAPGILAKSGILRGKKATIWDSGSGDFVKILEEGGATYTGANVEQDGKIITANGPHAAKEFGEKILEALE